MEREPGRNRRYKKARADRRERVILSTDLADAVRMISLRSLSTSSLGSICSDPSGQPSSDTPIMVWATWEEMETRLENLSPNPMDFLVIKGFFLTECVFPSRAAMSSLSDLSQLAWLAWLAKLDFLPEAPAEAPCIFLYVFY